MANQHIPAFYHRSHTTDKILLADCKRHSCTFLQPFLLVCVRRVNIDLEIFPISAKTGEGVEALADWLCTRIRTHKEKKKETNA